MAAGRIEPKRPVRLGWEKVEAGSEGDAETWIHEETGLVAVSTVDTATSGAPQHVLALRSAGGGRCSASHALVALADFGLLDAVEESGGTRGGRVFRQGIVPHG